MPATIATIRAAIQRGEYAAAERDARALLEQTETQHGPSALEVAEVLDVLVTALYSGRSQEMTAVLPLAERAVRMKEEGLGRDHVRVVPSLTNLGIVYRELDRLADSRAVLERALRIQERSSSENDPALGATLQALGAVLLEMGLYAEARHVYERDIGISVANLGSDNRDLGQKLYNFARLLVRMGDYEGARLRYERALEIVSKHDGAEHVGVAYILNGLGTVLDVLGEYDAARQRVEAALRIARERLGDQHELTVSCINNLGSLCCSLGDYASARQYYQSALEVRVQTLGPDHSRTTLVRARLADVEYLEGNYIQALALNEQTLRVLEKIRAPDDPELAWRLWQYSRVLLELGRYDEATTVLERALRIGEEKLGASNTVVGHYVASLGSVARRSGEFATARARYEKALGILEKVHGPEHPQLAPILAELAAVMQALGHTNESIELAVRAETIAANHVRSLIRALPEREALRYSSVTSGGLDVALKAASAGAIAEARARVFDAAIGSRALILDEMAARRVLLSRARDPKTTGLVRDLARANRDLGRLILHGPDPEDPAAYVHKIALARAAKDGAEYALAKHSSVFRDQQTRGRIGLAQVSQGLPRGAVLLSFVRYELDTPAEADVQQCGSRKTSSFVAFVLRAGETSPAAVDLGSEAEITGFASAWLGHMRWEDASPRAEVESRRAGEALRKRIWDPVVPYFAGSHLVLVVPEGQLNLVNFAALPDGESGYLADRETRIHYLAAERDVVAATPMRKRRDLVAVGGPDFDASTVVASLGVQAPPSGPSIETPRRSRAADCVVFRDLRFPPLLGAALEVKELRALWTQSKPRSARAIVLTGPAATESEIKRLARRSRICHLATHGFFIAGSCAQDGTGVRGIQALAPAADVGFPPPPLQDSPLLYAGLALAGANHRDACTDEEDGILTAEEVAAMDFQGTEWAVLSACGTGLGEVKTGEGVFGLRRAFQIAGARTLIMSLWSVKDRETCDWMLRLYSRRIQHGMDTASSVWAANRDVLEHRRATGQSTHPFYWAGFVAAGDWH